MDKPKFNGIEKYIFADVYMFITEHIDGDGSEKFWAKCVTDSRKLCSKYQDYQLCIDLVVAALCDIEYKIMGKPDKHGKTYRDWDKLKDSLIAKK